MAIKKVLYIQPVGCEGPGLIEAARPASIEVSLCRPVIGQKLPCSLDGYAGLVCLGGPMSVYDADRHPWLEDVFTLFREAVAQQIPCLGICLGSQALAWAMGASVAPMGHQEIGWYPIHLNNIGLVDPLLAGLDADITVFHWHGDRWEIPEGGELLASSERCDHQIFRIGPNAYGFQCHLEVMVETPPIWAEAYAEELSRRSDVSTPQKICSDTNLYAPALKAIGLQVFSRFWKMVSEPATQE